MSAAPAEIECAIESALARVARELAEVETLLAKIKITLEFIASAAITKGAAP